MAKIIHHSHPFHRLQYHHYQTWLCIKTKTLQSHFHNTKKDMKVIVISHQVLSSQGTFMEVVRVKYPKCLGHSLATKDHLLQASSIFIHRDINMDPTFLRIHLELMLIQLIVLKVQAALAPPTVG